VKNAIFLSGKAEAGKTTVANMLKKRLENTGNKVVLINFADYLKYVAKKYFNWDGSKNTNGRSLLQKIGTDIVRNRQPKFWAETVARFIDVFSEDFDYFITDDTRFIEEINCLKSYCLPSIAIRVKRLNFENHLTEKQRQHPSETSLDNYPFEYIIESESGLNNLSKEVDKFINSYFKEN
jgi:dephospho-CoA kinase